MAQRGPLVTAIVAVGGLVGLMTANAAGGLVTAGGSSPTPEQAGQTQTIPPSTEAPVETTTAPPVETTTEPTTAKPPPPAAPAAPAFPAEVVYDGKVNGNPAWVAVAVKGGDASAYICDGAAVESWLMGTAKDGKVDLKSKDGAQTLTADLQANGSLAGSVTIGGQPFEFTISVAPPPAGLYRGQDGNTTVGWIILPNGQQVGIAKTGTAEAPAPKLDPAKGGATVGGKFVPAEKVTGETMFG
jgi:hypothetical protein